MSRCFFCARTSHQILDGHIEEICQTANRIKVWLTVTGFIFVIGTAVDTEKGCDLFLSEFARIRIAYST